MFIRLPKKDLDFQIRYRFLSRTFQCDGEITVSSKPFFGETIEMVYVEKEDECGENIVIEDIVKIVDE